MFFPSGAALPKTNEMKEFFKKLDWKAILIGLLTLIVGVDKAPDAYDFIAGTTPDGVPTTPGEPDDQLPREPVWVVTALFSLNDIAQGPGIPKVPYIDRLGIYEVKVVSPKQPNREQVLKAWKYAGSFDSDALRVSVLGMKGPEKDK